MPRQLTDKTECLMLRGNYKTYLTKKEADFVSQQFAEGKDVVRLQDNGVTKTFFKYSILFILPAADIEKQDKVKKGDWMCNYGYWHNRGETCGHISKNPNPNE